ncbi:hypothetical protein JCM19239_3945 [Vibrio variabilis]|uniref:Acetyltransferase n=1 Tax=Vibrio variabilis TaxID=990271 RepID=A0ABQ0J646_9VIBR|nr:hypothetical protein JCM19239_3945 [Vibrio variabilis]
MASTLITGVKRDITLLDNVTPLDGDHITVLDISMEKNLIGLKKALEVGAEVFYADHHRSGEIPNSPQLDAHIDLDPNTCTSLIIDDYLQGQHHTWAITAAYGDNLIAKAEELAIKAGFDEEQRAFLKELGTLINYNGYGASVDDLHFDPAKLYQALYQYTSPFEAKNDLNSPYYALKQAYEADLADALAIQPTHESESLAVYELKDTAGSRRISGVYGNLLANQTPIRMRF